MSNIQFPSNPENGMIFEIIPGIFYKFNSGSNSWVRLKGSETLNLATPLSNGLMSKDDFNKLRNLIVPPLQTTLQGEECNSIFKSGVVDLYSLDDSLEISKDLKVHNNVSNSIEEIPWELHENTVGFDFNIPISNLLDEIKNRNLLKRVQLQGDKGLKGAKGDPGIDRLDTGPIGDDGESGANAQFNGSLISENIPFESTSSTNRAIVDVSTEEISDDENYIIVTRANIGNPDACPSLITPQDFASSLVVALNTIQGGKLVKNELISSNDCSLICRICSSSIYHLNFEELMYEVFEQFKRRVNYLKFEKEMLVKIWLNAMVSLFNEQKSALCCAIENCKSRNRNQRTRQYIETQRIQAALGDFQLLVDGENDRQLTNMDKHKNCPKPKESTSYVETNDDGVIVTLDSKIHISDPRVSPLQSVTTFLGKGSYIAEITTCCANFNASANNANYSGRAAILYKSLTGAGDVTSNQQYIDTSVITFPNFGSFNNESAAKNAYQGITISFEHAGGDISLWLLDNDGFTTNNEGTVSITIRDIEDLVDVTSEEAVGFVYTYRDEISFDNLLGRLTPYSGSLSASENFNSIITNGGFLTHGPVLDKDKTQIFFYDGSDGLSLFIISGEYPSASNDQEASILINVDVSNNTLPLLTKANTSNTDVKRITASQFQTSTSIDNDYGGFVIGALDPLSEYSVRIDPLDLSSIKLFVAADANGNDIIISQGGSEGIGGNIGAVQLNTAPLYQIRDVPDLYGGGNNFGLRVNNESSNQDVTLTRPVSLNISATVGGDILSPDVLISPGITRAIPLVEEQLIGTDLKTTSYLDQNFASAGWSSTFKTYGEGGTSTTKRQSSGGNPGAYRETKHKSTDEERVIVVAGRPTKSYYGPGSTGALKWEQYFATDQFGNTWVAIRDTSVSLSKSGGDSIYVRDANDDEIPSWFSDKSASVIFGGPSGVAPGSIAVAPPSYNSTIATYHFQNDAIVDMAKNGNLNHLDLSFDAVNVPFSGNPVVKRVVSTTQSLTDEERDLLIQEQKDIEAQLEQLQQRRQFIVGSLTFSSGSNTELTNVDNQIYALRLRYIEINDLLTPPSVDTSNINSNSLSQTVQTTTGAFSVGVALMQNGNIYRSSSSVLVNNTLWMSYTRSKLKSSNFALVTDTGLDFNSNPDFSSIGNNITLGYYVESTHDNGGDTRIIGIDNWKINVKNEVVIEVDDPNVPKAPPSCVVDGQIVLEDSSTLPRGEPGSPQSSTIVDINGAIRIFAPQSIRYILTDVDGNKYYSAYNSLNVDSLNKFQFISLGPPISVLSPPVEFSANAISEQSLDLSTVSSKLTSSQLKIAESLDGVARLTYVQELLGSSIDKLPDARYITDVEIQFKNMPFSSVDFGYLSAKVGLANAYADVLIDNFKLETEIIGQTVGEPEVVTGSIKRVVASQSGTDNSINGLIYSGLDSYYGDYGSGQPLLEANLDYVPNLHGNQFFTLNQAGTQKIAHANNRTGFQYLTNGYGAPLTTISGEVVGTDSFVVDDFGVVYVFDSVSGNVIAYTSINAGGLNVGFGDATGGAQNALSIIRSGLPVSSNGILTIGRYLFNGSFYNELILHVNGRWYALNSVPKIQYDNGTAFRDDLTTIRCCAGVGNTTGAARPVASTPRNEPLVLTELGYGSGGASVTTNAPSNPQPALPIPSSKITIDAMNAVQAQLDSEFNQFEFYTLDSGKIYKNTPRTGARTLFKDLGENAFCLRVNPRTRDIYYIVDNRGTTPKSGTLIRRLDIDDLADDGTPKIKTVIDFTSENSIGEGVFGITFGNSVPSDPTNSNQVLYALLSTFRVKDNGDIVKVRIVEVAEEVIPPVPPGPISQEIPLNSRWNTYVSGGRKLGNPSRVILSRVIPGGGCQLYYKQVQWYERGWRIGACCGALVDVGGTNYIVVKRSIGTDISCGGGESLNTSCIKQFIDIGDGHPAIAWPTSSNFDDIPGGGGEEFLGIPTSGFVNFVKDESLSSTIINKIKNGEAIKTVGNPAEEIPFILFPVA